MLPVLSRLRSGCSSASGFAPGGDGLRRRHPLAIGSWIAFSPPPNQQGRTNHELSRNPARGRRDRLHHRRLSGPTAVHALELASSAHPDRPILRAPGPLRGLSSWSRPSVRFGTQTLQLVETCPSRGRTRHDRHGPESMIGMLRKTRSPTAGNDPAARLSVKMPLDSDRCICDNSANYSFQCHL